MNVILEAIIESEVYDAGPGLLIDDPAGRRVLCLRRGIQDPAAINLYRACRPDHKWRPKGRHTMAVAVGPDLQGIHYGRLPDVSGPLTKTLGVWATSDDRRVLGYEEALALVDKYKVLKQRGYLGRAKEVCDGRA